MWQCPTFRVSNGCCITHYSHPWWKRVGMPLVHSSAKMGHGVKMPACLTHLQISPSILSHTHPPLGRPSLSSPHNLSWARQQNSPCFQFWGEEAVPSLPAQWAEPARELVRQAPELVGGEQQAHPFCWQSAARSEWDVLEISAQATRIHSPFQGLGSI